MSSKKKGSGYSHAKYSSAHYEDEVGNDGDEPTSDEDGNDGDEPTSDESGSEPESEGNSKAASQEQSQTSVAPSIEEFEEEPEPRVFVCCRPCAYWERELVKYNPKGKWDQDVKEKGQSGRPDLSGKGAGKKSEKKKTKGTSSGSGGRDNNEDEDEDDCEDSPKEEDKDKFVAIGEPCNAYRCYKDPCVPQGMAYCTRKHLTDTGQSALPSCPQKFPIKPVRFRICEPHEEEEDAPCCSQTRNFPSYNSSKNKRGCQGNNNNSAAPSCQGPQQQSLPLRSSPCCAGSDDNNSRIPREWIQELPSCNEKGLVETKAGKRRKSKGSKSMSSGGSKSSSSKGSSSSGNKSTSSGKYKS